MPPPERYRTNERPGIPLGGTVGRFAVVVPRSPTARQLPLKVWLKRRRIGSVFVGEMKDRMLRGELYVADDPELAADLAAAEALLAQLNRTPNSDRPARDELLRRLLGDVGDHVEVRSPFLLEYGARVSIGARTFVNFD